MTYQSGTLARDGRTVNHDPKPYLHEHWDRGAATPCFCHGDRYSATKSQFDTYAPRPEFAVLDNPILAAFRECVDANSHQHGSTLASQAAEYLHSFLGRPRWDHTPADQKDHARRVLTLLAGPEGAAMKTWEMPAPGPARIWALEGEDLTYARQATTIPDNAQNILLRLSANGWATIFADGRRHTSKRLPAGWAETIETADEALDAAWSRTRRH